MADWLMMGEISTLLATAILLLIYVSVYKRKPSRPLLYWILGWSVMAGRFLFGILNGIVGPSTFLAIAYYEATALSSLILLRAVISILNHIRFRFYFLLIFSAASLWIVFSSFFLKDTFWISLPTFCFFGAVQIFAGIFFLQSSRRFDSLGATIAGWSFIIWGIHKLDYPFIRPVQAFAAYGYFIGAFLTVLVGVGFLLFQFEQSEWEAKQLAQSLAEKESDLRASEETHRTLVHGLPDVVLHFDADCRYVFASPGVVELTGVPWSQCIGKSHRELGLPDPVCAFWEDAVGCVCDSVLPVERELRIDGDPSGSVYDVRFLPKRGPDGMVDGIIAVARNVTEQRRSFDQLSLERKRLRSLVELLEYQTEDEQQLLDFALSEALSLTSSRYGYIYLYDEEDQVLTLNSWSGLVMADCSVADKKTRYPLSETGYWGEVIRQRRIIINNDFHALSPLHKGYPEGHVRIVRFLSVPIFIGERIVGVVGVANKEADYEEADADQLKLLISPVFSRGERVRSANAIAEKDSLITAIMESMDDPLISLDSAGRYTGLFGKWFERNYVDADFFIGKNFAEAFGYPEAEPHEAALRKAAEDGQSVYEWTLPGVPVAESPVIQTIFTRMDVAGKHAGFVGLGRDITDRVRTEHRLARLLEEKTALVQEVQHRVKNNLQIIISLIELQLSAFEENPASGQLRMLQSRVHALASAFSDIGAKLSAESIPLSIQLNALAGSMIQLHADAGKDFKVHIDADTSVMLRMDVAIPVGLVVHEFMLNSLRYAVPRTGCLKILIRALLRDSEQCEILVSDDGLPTAPPPDPSGSGGIGLMIAEGLAAQLNGRIAVEARDGFSYSLFFPVQGAGKPKLP